MRKEADHKQVTVSMLVSRPVEMFRRALKSIMISQDPDVLLLLPSPELGWDIEEVDEYFEEVADGDVVTLASLCANIATQCFILEHSSPNSDILRSYLYELYNSGEVAFPDGTESNE